jgi:hypothetical protein
MMLFGQVDKNGRYKILTQAAAFFGWFLIYLQEKNHELAVKDGPEFAELYHKRGWAGKRLEEYLKRRLPDYVIQYSYGGNIDLCSADTVDKVWDELQSIMTVTDDSILIKKY